ncbi:MAG: putative metalloprotease CJM1_0395 family protein [Myxococcota bacterium]
MEVSGFSSFAVRPRVTTPTSGPSDAASTEGPADSARIEGPAANQELSASDQRKVQQLKARDAEVRAHEQAHLAAAGSLPTAGPFYEYETGPDGRRYAVGGEVKISAPEGQTPEETIRIQEQLIRAALAPAEPSNQDRRVAAGARAKIQQAKVDQATEERDDPEATDSSGAVSADAAAPTPTIETTTAELAAPERPSAYVGRALNTYAAVAAA